MKDSAVNGVHCMVLKKDDYFGNSHLSFWKDASARMVVVFCEGGKSLFLGRMDVGSGFHKHAQASGFCPSCIQILS